MTKIKIILVSLFVYLFSMCVYAETISYDEAEIIAESEVIELTNQNSGTLEFSKELFGLENQVTAYYFQYDKFYIIVGASKEYVPIIEYGEGDCFLMEIIDTEGVNLEDVELLYLGGLNYAYIYNSEYYCIDEKEIKMCEKNSLVEEKNDFILKDVEEQWQQIEPLITDSSSYTGGEIINPENFERYYYSCTKKTVPSYNFTYELMSNYSGYSSHCAPTAATNLLKYWYLRNNQKYNCLMKSSWLNSFKAMYGYMGTNSTVGTYTNKLVSAYSNYFNSCSGLGYVMVDFYSSPSMSKIASEINAGYPFHIAVYGSSKYGNHSMLALGYNYYTYRSGNTYTYSYYVMVADGWTNAPRYINCLVGLSRIDMVTVRLP